jgi:hypothetical protein
MDFQSIVSTTKLVNASTHNISGLVIGSPNGKHVLNVAPLGVIEVPTEWVQKGLDYRGQAKVKSTLEQYAPFLVPEKDPRVKEARDVLEKGQYTPAGAREPVKTAVYPLPPAPPQAPVYLQPTNQ